MEALAQRAVACKGWRWMPGMRWCMPGPMRGRMVGDDPSALLLATGWPDLTDPATMGCLLALVREAWGIPDLYVAPVEYVGPGPAPAWRAWAVEGPDLHVYTTGGMTEAAALVAALEAAP
jgi:hypothetical protein